MKYQIQGSYKNWMFKKFFATKVDNNFSGICLYAHFM